MSNEEILQKLSDAVIKYKIKDAAAAAQEAADKGMDPIKAINEGLVKGMNVIGELYGEHKIYLPQVLTAAKAMYAGLDILLPLIPASDLRDAKIATVAVVEGDVHDIGKNIVKTMLTASGFVVTDLGRDVSPHTIASKSEELKANVVCMSTLMTPTMDSMKATMDMFNENGYRGNCVITIGGPPTSPAFAKEIGADHRDTNAQDAVRYLKERV